VYIHVRSTTSLRRASSSGPSNAWRTSASPRVVGAGTSSVQRSVQATIVLRAPREKSESSAGSVTAIRSCAAHASGPGEGQGTVSIGTKPLAARCSASKTRSCTSGEVWVVSLKNDQHPGPMGRSSSPAPT
jgi:hypothetical protein